MGINIYVAGKTDDWERVRRIQNSCEALGHNITFDWTKIIERLGSESGVDGTLNDKSRRICADNDILGVQNAEMVIAYMSKGITGTLIEIGMALVFKPTCGILLVGEPPRDSIFFALPNVLRVEDESQVSEMLPA